MKWNDISGYVSGKVVEAKNEMKITHIFPRRPRKLNGGSRV